MSAMIRLPLTTEHALLGFLRQQPMHGYEIYQRLSDSTRLGLVWNVKQSQLYALLAKLERAGLIEATIEPQEPRPPRKVFHLTPKGHDAFQKWVSSPVKHGRNLRLDFLAKLYFARLEGPGAIQELIEGQRAACLSWLDTQEQESEDLYEDLLYDWLVHQFRIGQIQAMLAWLDTCEEALLALPTS